ncbi:hypothetical protein [Kutzneria sp. 744]|uniref:immunity protein Imm33 domain-containing protein n=1 Tax=Kutzneria sp. (strain 744) TaxID=345341 RepID=UPI0004BCF550|nr:hypothetical protein [Kutzneria sp. 744]
MGFEPSDHVCRRAGVLPSPVAPADKLGVSRQALSGEWPLNGVRLREDGTCGWYVWSGRTLSHDPDFFVPLHVEHLVEARPEVAPYLGLPPGWRFLLAPDHEDVWFDGSVLDGPNLV